MSSIYNENNAIVLMPGKYCLLIYQDGYIEDDFGYPSRGYLGYEYTWSSLLNAQPLICITSSFQYDVGHEFWYKGQFIGGVINNKRWDSGHLLYNISVLIDKETVKKYAYAFTV